MFVEDDASFPKRDVILAIKIGRFVQTFRWPRNLTESVEDQLRAKKEDV